MSKSKKDRPDKPAVGASPNLAAYSILEFCHRHCISRAHFYNLRGAGKGPREMRPGHRVLISAESAAEWRQQQTVPSKPSIDA
jgi:hypothetical protein